MSGGIAGFTQCVATNPMEVTKMFYQVRTPALAAAPKHPGDPPSPGAGTSLRDARWTMA